MQETNYTWANVEMDKPVNPLFVLLNHSDCEGYIEPLDGLPLAERLSSIVTPWPRDDRDRFAACKRPASYSNQG